MGNQKKEIILYPGGVTICKAIVLMAPKARWTKSRCEQARQAERMGRLVLPPPWGDGWRSRKSCRPQNDPSSHFFDGLFIGASGSRRDSEIRK